MINIFNKVTLQGMQKSRTRTIVTIIGVILSSAMITAVATFAISLQKYMIDASAMKYGDWYVEFLDVDSSFAKAQADNKKVANTITFNSLGYATLEGCQNPNKPYLFIAGFNDKSLKELPITLVSGRLPDKDNEIVIPSHIATNGGVELIVGDIITLDVGKRTDGNYYLGQHNPYVINETSNSSTESLVSTQQKTYTIVGICQRPSFEEVTAPGYTIITKADISVSDNINLFVKLNKPSQVHSYAKKESNGYSYVFNNEVLRFMGISDYNIFNTLLYSIGGILVVLIMIGSIFLIYNSFNISLNERTRQFGILASVGATEKQLRNSVLFEGLCIGAIGIPIGVLAGIGSIKLVISIVAKNFANILYSNIPLTLKISTLAIMVAIIVSLITILISAYIPARKAATTPIMESIRQTNEIKLETKNVKTSKVVEKICGLEGILALKNFKRNKKRYRSIILSLTLSVVLFISSSAFSMYLKQATEASVIDCDYDICFSTKNMDENVLFQLYDELKVVDGVYKSSYQSIMTYSMAVKSSDFSKSYLNILGISPSDDIVNLPLDIQFIEDSEYTKFLESQNLPVNEYTGENAKMTIVAKVNTYNEKNKQSKLKDMFTNNSAKYTITPNTEYIATDNIHTIDFTFVDVIPLDELPRTSSSPESTVIMVVAPYQLRDNFIVTDKQEEQGLTFLSKNPANSTSQMESIIQSHGITLEYNLININNILDTNRNIVFVVNIFAYVFIIMISLIAIANVFNTISTNIKLRRRELAMLRSVGMSDNDFQKMMNFECIFYGLRTLLFGLPISSILSWLIYKGVVISGIDLGFTFPWASLIISIIAVFFIVFITMIYSISKIKKENIIDALRDDMT